MCKRDAYIQVAGRATELLADPRLGAQWDHPSALPRMTIGALAGHLGRALLQVETYLDAEPPPVDARCVTAVEYYADLVGADDLDSELNVGVRQRALESAAGGHDALRTLVRQCLRRLQERLPGEPADRLVEVFGGRAMLLDDYLDNRQVEITVHIDDLAVSLGLPTPEIPEGALETAISVLVGIARTQHGSLAVLRALARRERDHDAALRVF